MSKARLFSAVGIVLCLGFGAWGALSLQVHSELGQLAPGGVEAAELSKVLAESQLARTWVVLVEGDQKQARMCLGRRLHEAVVADGQVERDASVEEVDQAVYELYFPRRDYFLADDEQALTRLLRTEGLRERLEALRSKLASPTGAFARKLAKQDPLQVFVGHLEQMRKGSGARLTREDDLLVTEQGGVVLLLRTKFSAFDASTAKRFESFVEAQTMRLKRECSAARAHVSQSATHRFSWRTEEMIRADIQRISLFSTIGMVVLFLLILPAGRALLGVFAPTFIGLSFAVGATALVFERVHGMSVAFGAAMLGVCVDYAVHWVIHDFTMQPGQHAHTSGRRVVARCILLGAGTTIAGLALLAGASFPGMRELSFFACVGVASAAAATLWLLPPWVQGRPVKRTIALSLALSPWVAWMRRPRVGWFVLLVAALLSLGLTRAKWSHGLESLLDRDPELLREDARVRESIARFSAGRLVAVRGQSVEEALQKLERVEPVLENLREKGVIDIAQSVHPYLWSTELQRSNLRAVSDPSLPTRISDIALELGFAEGAFDWPAVALRPEPLTFEDLKNSALAPMVAPFLTTQGEQVWAFAFLGEVADLGQVRRALREHDVIVFDQAAFLSDAFAAYRSRVFRLGLLGLGVIFVVLLLRYRRWLYALAAFLPAAAASCATLGLLGWLGTEINILHLIALLLVLGIGVDYGVFVVEPFHASLDEHRTVFLSIVTACLTTTLSFGLLALSDYAPLRSMGTALMVGVPLSLLLAPLSTSIAARASR